MAQDNRKMVNIVEIKPHVFKWIVDDANAAGEKLSKHIGNLLELMYYMGDKGKKTSFTIAQANSPVTKAIVSHQELERMQQLRSIVRHMAALYTETPSEEVADKLQQACDAADLNYDDVINAATADPFSSIIASTSGKDKIDQCIIWLVDTMKEHGRIKSKELYSMATKKGFNRRMVFRVRNILLEDPETPYIDAVREGNEWWLILKDTDNKEIKPTKPEAIYKVEDTHISLEALLESGQKVTLILNDNDVDVPKGHTSFLFG